MHLAPGSSQKTFKCKEKKLSSLESKTIHSHYSFSKCIISYHLRHISMKRLCLVMRGHNILLNVPLAIAVNKPF